MIKKYHVNLTKGAETDLEEIVSYIANDSVQNALRILDSSWHKHRQALCFQGLGGVNRNGKITAPKGAGEQDGIWQTSLKETSRCVQTKAISNAMPRKSKNNIFGT